jgi:hypothetical protein
MIAPTTLGDSLRDFADLCDLHPEWLVFACLVSHDGLAYNVFSERAAEPLDTARALASILVVGQEEQRMGREAFEG